MKSIWKVILAFLCICSILALGVGVYAVTSLIAHSWISITVGDSVAIYLTQTPEGLVDEVDGFTVNNGEPVKRGDSGYVLDGNGNVLDYYMINTDDVPVTVEVKESYEDVIVWFWVWDDLHEFTSRMESPLPLDVGEVIVFYLEWEVLPDAVPTNEFDLPILFETLEQ